MNYDLAKEISEAIYKKLVWSQWLYYAVILILAFLGSCVGNFLSGYSKKRGEQLATKADLEDIKQQLKMTTEITENIRNDIAHEIWRKQQTESLRRQKLEEYLMLIYTAKEDLSKEMFNHFFYQKEIVDIHAANKSTMLMKLYFPELKEAHSMFLHQYSDFKSWLAAGMKEQLAKRQQGQEVPVISEEHMSGYTPLLNGFGAVELVIEAKASQIAETLNSPLQLNNRRQTDG